MPQMCMHRRQASRGLVECCCQNRLLQHGHRIGQRAYSVPTQFHVVVEPTVNNVQVVVNQTRKNPPTFQVDARCAGAHENHGTIFLTHSSKCSAFNRDHRSSGIFAVECLEFAAKENQIGRVRRCIWFARHVWIILAILGRQQIVFGDWVRRSSLVEQWSTNIPYSPSRTPAVQIRPFIAAMTPQLRSSFRKLNHHRSRGNNRYSALECKYSVDHGPAPTKMATWTGGVRRNAHAL